MAKVLIVEDDENLQFIYGVHLERNGIQVLKATTLAEAKAQFTANNDITAIVFDGELKTSDGASIEYTLELVPEFKKTFTGPMIAAAGSPENRENLVAAGCTHQCIKDDLPKTLKALLGLV